LKTSWTAAVASCKICLCSREGGPHPHCTHPWDLLAITPAPGTGPKAQGIVMSTAAKLRIPGQSGILAEAPGGEPR
jgi:hypothetical protein